jgi:hypothetical protein
MIAQRSALVRFDYRRATSSVWWTPHGPQLTIAVKGCHTNSPPM